MEVSRVKTYTIVCGVNGVGKSSLIGILKAQRTDLGIIIDVDKITATAGSSCNDKRGASEIEKCFRLGVSFTQETTFLDVQTARRAKEEGYYIRLYYVGLNTLAESLKRIQNRVEKGGHDIPKEDVARRFTGRFDALAQILPYCDEADFFDNDNGFVEVAEYRNGELLAKGSHLPDWLNELQDRLNGLERSVQEVGNSR